MALAATQLSRKVTAVYELAYENTGPGKFEGSGNGTVAKYFYDLDFATEDCGDVEITGWHAFFDISDDPILILWSSIATEECVAAIISEDSQGFVSVETFSDIAEARAAWNSLSGNVESRMAEMESEDDE